MKLRRKDAGRILIMIGVVMGMVYTLIGLNNPAMASARLGSSILYMAIVAIASGLILLGLGGRR